MGNILTPPPPWLLPAARRLNPPIDVDVDILAVTAAAGASTPDDWNAGVRSNVQTDVNGILTLTPNSNQTIFKSAASTAGLTVEPMFNLAGKYWFDFFPDPSVFAPEGFVLSAMDIWAQQDNGVPLHSQRGDITVVIAAFDQNWNRDTLFSFVIPNAALPTSAGLYTINFFNAGIVRITTGQLVTRTGSGRDRNAIERTIDVTFEGSEKVSHIRCARGFSIGLWTHNLSVLPTAQLLGYQPTGTFPAFDVNTFWRAAGNFFSQGAYTPDDNGPSPFDVTNFPGSGSPVTGAIPGDTISGGDNGGTGLSPGTSFGTIPTLAQIGGLSCGQWGVSREGTRAGGPSAIWKQPYHNLRVVTFHSSGTVTIIANLGLAPVNEIQFRSDYSQPSGTTVTFQVYGSTDGISWSAPWAAVDGQIFTAAQTYQYYKVTATLTATSDTFNSPQLYDIFISDRVRFTTWKYTEDVDSTSTIDPVTAQSSVGELKLPALRLGRGDARDIITQIATQYTVANIEAWVYLRNTITGQRYFVNLYRLEDREPALGEETLIFVSGMDRLLATVPPFLETATYPPNGVGVGVITGVSYNAGTGVVTIAVAGTPFTGLNIVGWTYTGITGVMTNDQFLIQSGGSVPPPTDHSFSFTLTDPSQVPSNGDTFTLSSEITQRGLVDYAGQDFAAVYKDLITNQAQVPARYIGTLPPTTGRTTVGQLSGAGRKAIEVLQEVALHCGGALAWIQGRICFVNLYAPLPSDEVWSEADYVDLKLSAGAGRRMPSIAVTYGYDFGAASETPFSTTFEDANALLGMGRPNIYDTSKLSDTLCQWNDLAEAEYLANQLLQAWSTGVRIWEATLAIPRPWREFGDRITISTSQYTDRQLNFTTSALVDVGTPVKGRISIQGVIVGKNLQGDKFQVAIPGLNSVVANSNIGTTSGLNQNGTATIIPSATENTAAGTGTLTLVVTDPLHVIDKTLRIKFYQTINGVRTLVAPTTAPGAGVTAGTYTLVSTLDPKHVVIVEPIVYYADGKTFIMGAWTFDLDKVSDVINLAVSYSGRLATVTAVFDTDTAIGAAKARYSIDGAGFANTFTVASNLTGSFGLQTLASGTQLVEVQGQDSDGNWGNVSRVIVDQLATTPTAVISIGNNQGPTDVTALAAALINAPDNVIDLLWLASTSSMPTQASVVASGAVATRSGPGVPFTIANLGFSLALGDTIYLGIQPRGVAGGLASFAFIGIRATRTSLSATKIAQWPAAGLLHPYVSTSPYSRNLDEIDSNGFTLGMFFTGTFDLPDNATVVKVTVEVYEQFHGAASYVEADFYNTPLGSTPGGAFAILTGTGLAAWQIVNSGVLGISTSGQRFTIGLYIANASMGWTATDQRVRSVQIQYTPADSQATR